MEYYNANVNTIFNIYFYFFVNVLFITFVIKLFYFIHFFSFVANNLMLHLENIAIDSLNIFINLFFFYYYS